MGLVKIIHNNPGYTVICKLVPYTQNFVHNTYTYVHLSPQWSTKYLIIDACFWTALIFRVLEAAQTSFKLQSPKNCQPFTPRAIWYHVCNFKNMKNTHGGVLLVVNLQALSCNLTKTHTPPGVFFTFFKLYKCSKLRRSSHIYLTR